MDSEAKLLRQIRAHGVQEFHRVRFRKNRTRLLSVSRDGRTLNLHSAFRTPPPEVVEAIAAFLTAGRGTAEARRAADRLRRWVTDAAPRPAPPPRPRPGRCCGTLEQRRFLAALYQEYNRAYCGGRLPHDLHLRFSDRMRSRLGHVRLYREPEGRRTVVELAINIDLLREGNEAQLRDTLLHEMAHVEAWLDHGERGHGPRWRRIARRLGCVPRACAMIPSVARPPGSSPTSRVPPLDELTGNVLFLRS